MLRVLSLVLFVVSLFNCIHLSAQAIGEGKYFLSRFALKHREHKGMGYDQGYSTAALFVCPTGRVTALPFVDGRVHVFNNEELAANLGIGTRLSNTQHTYLFGLNAYYDYRNVNWLTTHQLSCGMEILSKYVDVRVNGYYPFSGTYQDDPIVFNRFKGHYMQVTHKVRYALPCADAELGWTLPDPFDQIGLYFGVGYYYLFKQQGFNQSVGNVPGVKARLTASPSSYLSFGAEYTYDKLFRGRATGFIALNIPLGKNGAKSKQQKPGQEKTRPWVEMQTQDVVRNEIIPVLKKTHYFNHLQADGEPVHFVFVNNQIVNREKGLLEEGTFENPYSTLSLGNQQAATADILYVFAGDGSSNGYDQGVILTSNQILTSSGVELEMNGVRIPALTPNALPVLTNHSGPVIHITAPGSSVHGFKIEGSDDHAVYIEAGGVTLTDNEIVAGPNYSAIKVCEEVGGEVSTVRGNLLIGQGGELNPAVVAMDHIKGKYLFSENEVFAIDGQNGITITDPSHATYMVHNRFGSSDPSGVAIEYQISESGQSGKHQCFHNSVDSGFYEALHIEGTTEAATIFEIHDNQLISETLGVGISYTSASHQGYASILNNTIAAAQDGIYISDREEAASAIDVTNNTLHMLSGTPAISSVFSGRIDVNIEENKIDYAQNLTGKFSGIATHLKTNDEVGSALKIVRNTFKMPSYDDAITLKNDRCSDVLIDIMNPQEDSCLD